MGGAGYHKAVRSFGPQAFHKNLMEIYDKAIALACPSKEIAA
jgi:hypothetical protein